MNWNDVEKSIILDKYQDLLILEWVMLSIMKQ